MAVDAYLKVNEHGFTIGEKGDQLITDPLTVMIDLSTVQYGEAIKFGKDPVRYHKTYDGVRANSGIAWQEAIRQAQLVDPKAAPYMTCDIPMTLLGDVKSVKSVEVAKAGLKIGHSTSTTNRAHWVELTQAAKAAGLSKQKVVVKLTAELRQKNTYTWGLIKFELIGPYVEQPVPPAAA